MPTFYLDYNLGSDANTGSAFGAGTAWKTLTLGATAARIAPGDIIKIAKSPAPTSLGMTATWTNLSKTVTLNSAVTATIEDCEDAWVASANVTATASATEKQGTNSCSLAIAAGFTTGKVAYEALAGSTDFSGYQQVSFWIRSSATVAAGVLTLNLCSDTIGATSVNSIAIPAIPQTAVFQVVTVDTGGALGSAIQSVSVNAASDPGTVTLLIDNIIACKASSSADSLTLSSLISKNSSEQGGTEAWYGIQSINGTTVMLDNATSASGTGEGYYGTTETVTTYKRETIKTTAVASISTVQEIMDSGTLAGGNIQFQGGYDTGTGNQTGETFFDGQNGQGYGIYLNIKSFITLNYLNGCRYNQFMKLVSGSNNNTITNISANNNSYGIAISDSNNNSITTISGINNNIYGLYFSALSNNTISTISNANNNTSYGVWFASSFHNKINSTSANNNGGYGVYFVTSGLNIINNMSTSDNTTAGVYNDYGTNYFNNCTIGEATEFSGAYAFSNAKSYSQKHDGTAYSKIVTDGGNIVSEASTLTNGSGIQWKLTTANTTNRQSNYPLTVSIAKIAVTANNLVTVKAWFLKGHATNIAAQLVCRGGQIAGVSADVTATKANDTSEEELTITFTPTEAGVVEIEAWAYYVAGHSTVIVDAMTITQA